MVLKEESGPLRAIDIASGDMCLVECLEENSPCLMYPEEDGFFLFFFNFFNFIFYFIFYFIFVFCCFCCFLCRRI